MRQDAGACQAGVVSRRTAANIPYARCNLDGQGSISVRVYLSAEGSPRAVSERALHGFPPQRLEHEQRQPDDDEVHDAVTTNTVCQLPLEP